MKVKCLPQCLIDSSVLENTHFSFIGSAIIVYFPCKGSASDLRVWIWITSELATLEWFKGPFIGWLKWQAVKTWAKERYRALRILMWQECSKICFNHVCVCKLWERRANLADREMCPPHSHPFFTVPILWHRNKLQCPSVVVWMRNVLHRLLYFNTLLPALFGQCPCLVLVVLLTPWRKATWGQKKKKFIWLTCQVTIHCPGKPKQ